MLYVEHGQSLSRIHTINGCHTVILDTSRTVRTHPFNIAKPEGLAAHDRLKAYYTTEKKKI